MRSALATAAVLAAAPGAAQAVPVHHVEMKALCQLTHLPKRLPRTPAGIEALCRSALRKNTEVTGWCGSAWIFDSSSKSGWVQEFFGLKTANRIPIRLVVLQAHWYNYSKGTDANFTLTRMGEPIGGTINWYQSYRRNAYTQTGYVGSYLDAYAIRKDGKVCDDTQNKPYDFIWA